MDYSRSAAVGVLALSLLMGGGAVVSHAHQDNEQKAKGATLESTIGMVDLEKIYNASDSPQQFSQAAAQIESDGLSRIDAMKVVPWLDDKELSEYGDLVGKKVQSAADKARIEELVSFSDKRGTRQHDLETKPEKELTEDDKRALKISAQQRRNFDRMFEALDRDIKLQINEREVAVKRDIIAKLRAEVLKVAKSKKIDHVFDSSAMVCSTNDLTQAVILKIKKPSEP